MAMSRRTKALQIPKRVKDAVYERDGGRCIWCGSAEGLPEAHFISRAQGGLGIEENVLTLCRSCHRRYDQTEDRKDMRVFFQRYLQCKYQDWDEERLVYRK